MGLNQQAIRLIIFVAKLLNMEIFKSKPMHLCHHILSSTHRICAVLGV